MGLSDGLVHENIKGAVFGTYLDVVYLTAEVSGAAVRPN